MKRLLLAGLVLLTFSSAAQAQKAAGYTLKVYTADWCVQCQREKPEVERLAKQYGVRIMTIDCTASAPKHVKVLPTYEVFDSKGRLRATETSIDGLKRLASKLLRLVFNVAYVPDYNPSPSRIADRRPHRPYSPYYRPRPYRPYYPPYYRPYPYHPYYPYPYGPYYPYPY